MIRGLFRAFGRNIGDAAVRRLTKHLQHRQVPGVEQELAHQRLAVIAVRLLDEEDVAEVPAVAQERERIRVAPCAFNLAGEGQPQFRLSDEVETDIRHGDVFFKRWRMPAPRRNALAENERVVAHPEREFEKRTRAHICPTSSGMS